MMRRVLFLSALLTGVAPVLHVAPALANPTIVVDVASGRVLESEDAFQRWHPASLTKLMTAYVVFRAIQNGEITMKSPVVITKKATTLPPSKMGYKPGAVLTMDAAIKILMVKSANDVAYSVGNSVSGTQEKFAERMNAESRRLGMTDTNWMNSHGLHDENQYTSARDLAILARALRTEFPQYAGYFSIEGLLAGGKQIATHNNLLARYDGADGMKTGYICPSGFNLVASATRDGRTLLAVVVGGETVPSRDEKAADLLTSGFATAPNTGPMLNAMKNPSPVANPPVNMYDKLCSKEVRAARAQEYKELREKIKAGEAEQPPAPVYLAKLPRPRKLVAIELGGADGPVPPGVAEALAAADVPIPTWRPDMPVPQITATEQGDFTEGEAGDEQAAE